MQLVAVGAQDVFLTSNPQITFFKIVYRRHTNFSREAIQQTLNGSISTNSRLEATITRDGDLINRMYIECDLLSAPHICDNVGYNMLDNVTLKIGGQQIDKLYGHWMETWSELTEPNSNGFVASPLGITLGNGDNSVTDFNTPWIGQVKSNSAIRGSKFQRMACAGGVCKSNGAFTFSTGGNGQTNPTPHDTPKGSVLTTINVPLPFSFCKNIGLSIPIIALQYHEVTVELKLTSVAGIIGTIVNNHKLWVDYIYLDREERRRFAQVSHEYLIEQVQYQNFTDNGLVKTLEINHPVKELVFTGARDATALTPVSLHDPDGSTGISTLKLTLNGQDRFAPRHAHYFTRTQIWEHHKGFGGVTSRDSIGVYSFALKPEDHQPSGTCNFSRIDVAQIVLGKGDALEVYAINYNILKIQSGMGGLAYSN